MTEDLRAVDSETSEAAKSNDRTTAVALPVSKDSSIYDA